VAGIGEKGAQELIQKYHSIEYIYEHLDELDIKPGMKAKLEASKENAFLSKTLGTICLEAPIDTNIASYLIKEPDVQKSTKLLTSLEMFKILKRLNFDGAEAVAEQPRRSLRTSPRGPPPSLPGSRRA
jgi:DNA polymerase-1